MRVTMSHIMEMASEATSQSESQVAKASAQVTSGVAVNVPSDNLVDWEAGQRAQIRDTESTSRGSAITLAQGKMQASDSALTAITTALTTAKQLASEMANGTLDTAQRGAAANEAQALHDTILAAANAVGPDGTPVFSGSQKTTPFSANDTYNGDNTTQSLQVAEGQTIQLGVSGSVLTSANGGVDVLGTLTNLVNALTNNDDAGIQQAMIDLQKATTQVATAQGAVGAQEQALNSAQLARSSFETNLQGIVSKTLAADTVTAATALAQAQNGYNACTTVESVVQQLASKNIS